MRPPGLRATVGRESATVANCPHGFSFLRAGRPAARAASGSSDFVWICRVVDRPELGELILLVVYSAWRRRRVTGPDAGAQLVAGPLPSSQARAPQQQPRGARVAGRARAPGRESAAVGAPDARSRSFGRWGRRVEYEEQREGYYRIVLRNNFSKIVHFANKAVYEAVLQKKKNNFNGLIIFKKSYTSPISTLFLLVSFN